MDRKQSRNLLPAALTVAVLMILSSLAPVSWSSQAPYPVLAQMEGKKVFLPMISRGQSNQEITSPSDWLIYINHYRALGNLPPVAEDQSWSMGGMFHSRYTVKNDVLQHDEDEDNPFFTPEGQQAAQTSNLMASGSAAFSDQVAIDHWMQGPFHAIGILDPELLKVGFGSYRESDGGLQMGAALDIIRGLGPIPAGVKFPIQWPKDGATISLGKYTGGEVPDPLASCPGYQPPTGLPILLQIGPGNLTPQVTSHSFSSNGLPLEHCVYDETDYPGELGRSVLNMRDAIVLVPREPLLPGSSYSVSVTSNGKTYRWTFQVGDR